jgi:hypothetical protein
MLPQDFVCSIISLLVGRALSQYSICLFKLPRLETCKIKLGRDARITIHLMKILFMLPVGQFSFLEEERKWEPVPTSCSFI